MIIDGHAHACGSYYGVDKINDYLEKHNIDKVVLCGGEPGSQKDYAYPMLSKIFTGPGLGLFFNKIICKVTKMHHLSQEIDAQNIFVHEIAEKIPDKVINAYWINPSEKNCMEKMKDFYETKGYKLIKMHQCWTDFQLESDSCHQIFQWAGQKNIAVFIHLYSQNQVEAFAKMANTYSNVHFIVAHMIGANYLSEHLEYDNVYWDLSAPQLYSNKILKKIYEKYGAEKLILGSDTPYGKNNIELVIERLKKIKLTQTELEKITGENILKLLNMK